MSRFLIVASCVLAGCTAAEGQAMGTKITDATQAVVDGVEIGVGNFARREYTKADGTQVRGLTATLFPPHDAATVIVGAGSVATFEGHRFVIERVESPLFGKAYVEISAH